MTDNDGTSPYSDTGKCHYPIIDIHTYIAMMVAFGQTKGKATEIARKEYTKQHGKTPEEYHKEMGNFDWSTCKFFNIPPNPNPFKKD